MIAALSGCMGGDPDPGSCYSSGEFYSATVSRGYANSVCEQHVSLLLAGCVQVNDLGLSPDRWAIQNYCANNVTDRAQSGTGLYPAYGRSGRYSFQIRHTCNFVNNPSYDCVRYASRPITLLYNDLELKERLSQVASSAPAAQGNWPQQVFVHFSFTDESGRQTYSPRLSDLLVH